MTHPHVILEYNWGEVQRIEYYCYRETLSIPIILLVIYFLSMYIYEKGKIGIKLMLNTVSFKSNTRPQKE